MFELGADFGHRDAQGRFRLAGLRMHERTPFADIARQHTTVLFVDGDEAVLGTLIHDPDYGWMGIADWDTREVREVAPTSTVSS